MIQKKINHLSVLFLQMTSRTLLSFFVVVMLIVPMFSVSAQGEEGTSLDGQQEGTSLDGQQDKPTSDDLIKKDYSTLQNPLGDVKDIPTFVEKLLGIVKIIGTPIVALALIYSGYLLVSAQGNPEKLKKAKEAITYSIVGALILIGAVALATAIHGTVMQLTT